MSDQDNVTEAIIDFCNALEAALVNLKRRLGNKQSQKTFGLGEAWDPSKIKWEQKEGSKGLYERSEDIDKQDFKAMLKQLAAKGGKLTRDGMFYWLFQNGSTIGRKKARFQKKKEVS